jgi:hypothetical protein
VGPDLWCPWHTACAHRRPPLPFVRLPLRLSCLPLRLSCAFLCTSLGANRTQPHTVSLRFCPWMARAACPPPSLFLASISRRGRIFFAAPRSGDVTT